MPFTYPLPDGTLTLHTQGDVAPDTYLSVAARNNPHRAFLFVSHLLGKHLPVPVQRMSAVQQRLAALIPTQAAANAPLLFIGMAETATALARGVYDQWLAAHPQEESLYIATSRYVLAGHERIEFSEAHSHAPAIGLHIPQDNALYRRFCQARTVVLIDDELSTGNTFVNLVHALQRRGLPLRQVIMLSLTDCAGEHGQQITAALAPLSVTRLSLLQGKWQYHRQRCAQFDTDWQTQSNRRITLPAAPDIAARAGTDNILTFNSSVQKTCQPWLADIRRLLLLGCGEYMYAPFRLAVDIAAQHRIDVAFCASTRSPIRPWGIIKSCRQWQDPYGEDIPHFLYNYQRDDYDAVWLVSERPGNPVLHTMSQELQARLLYLPSVNTLEDHTLY